MRPGGFMHHWIFEEDALLGANGDVSLVLSQALQVLVNRGMPASNLTPTRISPKLRTKRTAQAERAEAWTQKWRTRVARAKGIIPHRPDQLYGKIKEPITPTGLKFAPANSSRLINRLNWNAVVRFVKFRAYRVRLQRRGKRPYSSLDQFF